MYRTANGEEIFIIDGHVHLWDGSPDNQRNVHGKQFIDCFYGYHQALSPQEYLWPKEKFDKYDMDTMIDDLFEQGYDDMAIFQPTYLKDFYVNGFNTTEQNAVLKEKYPDRFILNGAWDPRDGEAGLVYLRELVGRFGLKGVKLYTAEWKGSSKGYKLSDPWAKRYLEECAKLGVKNIHVHKGPTILPLNRDAFDVADIDDAATSFPELNFIVEHVGLPRLDDFCWIAVQEPNVYGGLAVALPFIHSRPDYFNHVISELLFWLGADRLLYGSDYAIWSPKWMVEKFMALELPEEITRDKGVALDLETKKKIMGLNAAKLYDIDVEAQKQRLTGAAPVREGAPVMADVAATQAAPNQAPQPWKTPVLVGHIWSCDIDVIVECGREPIVLHRDVPFARVAEFESGISLRPIPDREVSLLWVSVVDVQRTEPRALHSTVIQRVEEDVRRSRPLVVNEVVDDGEQVVARGVGPDNGEAFVHAPPRWAARRSRTAVSTAAASWRRPVSWSRSPWACPAAVPAWRRSGSARSPESRSARHRRHPRRWRRRRRSARPPRPCARPQARRPAGRVCRRPPARPR